MGTSQGMRPHATQLSKVEIIASDEQLKIYLSKAISALENQLGYVKSGPPLRLNKASDQRIVDLYQYCQKKLKDVKPEWMITAEQNGWAPKIKK